MSTVTQNYLFSPSGQALNPQVNSAFVDLISQINTVVDGKANLALSNLASVAINLSLLPGTDNSIDLGSSSKRWVNLFAKDLNAGASGTAGSLGVFPATASKGKILLSAADSGGNFTTTITNASQAAARTYTIPDAGASASFLMTAGAQTITGQKIFSPPTGTMLCVGALADLNEVSGVSHIFEVTNDASTYQVIRVSTYGAAASLNGQNNVHWYRAGGTAASPSATLSGDGFMSFGFRGRDSSGTNTDSQGAIQALATENWTSTARGLKLAFETTAIGATTRVRQVEIGQNKLSMLNSATIDMGSSKITSLANGTASSDAAAFGQVYYGFQAPVQATSATTFSTTSNTFQTTNCSATITPTSSSHRIKITVTGVCIVGAVSKAGYITLARGTTDLSASGNGFQEIAQTVGAGSLFTPCSITFIDSPATTSATTYNVRIKNDDNVTAVKFGNGFDTVMILEEIV